MDKADGAFLTIGELAQELGVAQHILRYWESRFPQLRPLQRAGNRRYYRPQDVDVAKRINRLLNVEGFTIKGAAKALSDRSDRSGVAAEPIQAVAQRPASPPPSSTPPVSVDRLLDRLHSIRGELISALGEDQR
ncbi:MAG: MerR family transcriptional regulator [Sphingobium sp.]